MVEAILREFKVIGNPDLLRKRDLNFDRLDRATEKILNAELLIFICGPSRLFISK